MVLALRDYLLCITNLILLLSIHIVSSHSHLKSVTLTPSNTNSSGSYILNHVDEVTVVNNRKQWRVTTRTQSAWHFIIYIDESWGFDPNYRSTLTFSVDSPSLARPHTFNDLLFGFSSLNNAEYFSLWIPMDTNGGDLNKIYPGCDTKAVPTQSFAVGDIATRPDYDRNCDIAGGSCVNWSPFLPENHGQPNRFPIHITLENDPESNRASVSFHSRNSKTQTCGFIRFAANRGLKMYFGGNERGEQFLLDSFHIERQVFVPFVEESTTSRSPTFVPTDNPTTFTQSPSLIPTEIPTISPIITKTITSTSLPPVATTQTPPIITKPAPITTKTASITTKTPTVHPTQRALSCGDSVTDMLHHTFAKNATFLFYAPGNLATLTISTCDPITTIESTITLTDSRMQQIGFDSNGCNDKHGRAKLVADHVPAGLYTITVGTNRPDEGLFAMYVTCAISKEMIGFCNMFGLY